MKLCWLFPFSSYETKIPKILTGLRSHFSCNGLLLLFFHFPNQIAFVFFRFNFRRASEPKLSTISKAFSTDVRSDSFYWLSHHGLGATTGVPCSAKGQYRPDLFECFYFRLVFYI